MKPMDKLEGKFTETLVRYLIRYNPYRCMGKIQLVFITTSFIET